MKPLSVLLADDHTLLRAGLRSLLEEFADIEISGEASTGREALALTRSLRPDVILMDIAMPELNGLDATVRITKEFPAVKVLILSMHKNEVYVARALQAGASGYLLKDAASAELVNAIRAVAAGGAYLSPSVARTVIKNYLLRDRGNVGPLERLTPRQAEILRLIAEGNSTKEIAVLLRLSPKTVETHRIELMERLDIHDVPGLVRYAIRVGLISLDT